MSHFVARILIVEDEPANCLLFEVLLRRRGGFQTVASENVEEILTLARNREIDLVVLDVSLMNSHYRGESVDGIAIARLLKGDPLTQSIPILIATAHTMPGDRERILRSSGADDFIGKPITDGRDFVERVTTLLCDGGTSLAQFG